MISKLTVICGSCVIIAGTVYGASNIDPANNLAWCENMGWSDWRPSDTHGVVVRGTILSGYIWAENVGWIHLGDGEPEDGPYYGNAAENDYGVNVTPDTDELWGLAWGENIGWVSFSALPVGSDFAPRIDFDERRLYGYAWGENIGWINLDATEFFVGLLQQCVDRPGDLDRDDDVDLDDWSIVSLGCISGPEHLYAPQCECADTDADADVDLKDLAALQKEIAVP